MKVVSLSLAMVLASIGAGCIGADETAEPTSTDGPAPIDVPDVPKPKTETTEGTIQQSFGTPLRSFSSSTNGVVTPKGNITGYVIEVEWTAATPTAEKLDLWVRQACCIITDANPTELAMPPEPIAKVTGSSPLRIVLTRDAFEADGDYDVLVRAASDAVGIVAQQPFTLYITSFNGMTVDEAFTAVA